MCACEHCDGANGGSLPVAVSPKFWRGCKRCKHHVILAPPRTPQMLAKNYSCEAKPSSTPNIVLTPFSTLRPYPSSSSSSPREPLTRPLSKASLRLQVCSLRTPARLESFSAHSTTSLQLLPGFVMFLFEESHVNQDVCLKRKHGS